MMAERELIDLSGRSIDKISPHFFKEEEKRKAISLNLDRNQINKLEHLSGWPSLRQLSMASNRIVRLAGLDQLDHLTALTLPNNSIVALEGISRLNYLVWLNLSGNSIKVIENLEHNTALKHLDLSDNNITSLADLSPLKQLKTLLLHGNMIRSLAGAATLLPKSISILSLAENEVHDLPEVRHLRSLHKLDQLSLMNNPCVSYHSITHQSLLYRSYVLSCCTRLHLLDGLAIGEVERRNGLYLVSTSLTHQFGPGQNAELLQHLEKVVTPSASLPASSVTHSAGISLTGSGDSRLSAPVGSGDSRVSAPAPSSKSSQRRPAAARPAPQGHESSSEDQGSEQSMELVNRVVVSSSGTWGVEQHVVPLEPGGDHGSSFDINNPVTFDHHMVPVPPRALAAAVSGVGDPRKAGHPYQHRYRGRSPQRVANMPAAGTVEDAVGYLSQGPLGIRPDLQPSSHKSDTHGNQPAAPKSVKGGTNVATEKLSAVDEQTQKESASGQRQTIESELLTPSDNTSGTGGGTDMTDQGADRIVIAEPQFEGDQGNGEGDTDSCTRSDATDSCTRSDAGSNSHSKEHHHGEESGESHSNTSERASRTHSNTSGRTSQTHSNTSGRTSQGSDRKFGDEDDSAGGDGDRDQSERSADQTNDVPSNNDIMVDEVTNQSSTADTVSTHIISTSDVIGSKGSGGTATGSKESIASDGADSRGSTANDIRSKDSTENEAIDSKDSTGSALHDSKGSTGSDIVTSVKEFTGSDVRGFGGVTQFGSSLRTLHKSLSNQFSNMAPATLRSIQSYSDTCHNAAMLIQAHWRGYACRNLDPRVQEIKHKIRTQRLEEHLMAILFEMQRRQQIDADEQQIRATQLELIKNLASKVTTMEKEFEQMKGESY